MYLRINLRVSGLRAPVPATLVDLSGGGSMVTARTMLQPHIAVEFDLPRDGAPLLRLAGKIRKVTYWPNDRTFHYAIEFGGLSEEDRDALLRFIIAEQRRTINVTRGEESKPGVQTRLHEQRTQRRVDVNVPVRVAIANSPVSFDATAMDLGTGGTRLLVEKVLRQEWELMLSFTLPSDVLRSKDAKPFKEMRIMARALPGIKQYRGRYIQSLEWVDPDPKVTEELHRFVQAAALALGRGS